MIHTSITADNALRDALVAVEIAQCAHNKALRLAQTQEQAKTLPKLHAANHALMAAQNKARRND
jgi:hypothetical protein